MHGAHQLGSSASKKFNQASMASKVPTKVPFAQLESIIMPWLFLVSQLATRVPSN